MSVDESAVQQLVAVGGFDAAVATDALQRFSGEVDAALLHLLGDGASSPPHRKPTISSDSDDSDDESDESSVDDYSGSDDETEAPLVVVAPDTLDESYWGELPPDVMQVLGRWLAEHLGQQVERQTAPDYLHPLRTQAELNERGRARVSATLGMMRAIQACRQTCRIWRDEIPYDKVTELALDGVRVTGAVLPGQPERPPPECGSPVTGRGSKWRQTIMLWTWWPGGRVLRSADWYERNPRPTPGRLRYTGNQDVVDQEAASRRLPNGRCPACRTPTDPRIGEIAVVGAQLEFRHTRSATARRGTPTVEGDRNGTRTEATADSFVPAPVNISSVKTAETSATRAS